MRVVLDTNILTAAFISRVGVPAQIVKFWLNGRFDIVTSVWQIEEFRRISRYDRVKTRIRPAEIGTFINILRHNATVLERLPSVEVSPDPDDNYVVATALAGGAHFLVTGDETDLLALAAVEGARIVSARAFVKQLR